MEKFAHNISEIIAEKLGYDEDKKSVIAYGLISLFQMITIFLAICIIGLVGRFWEESIVIFIAVGLLRKGTGGAHSDTMQGCLVISIFCISLLAFLSKYLFGVHLIPPLYFVFPITIAFVFAFFLVYKLAPVASQKKPIEKPEKIARLRKKSFITLTIYYIIAITLILLSKVSIGFINISLSLTFATLWQAFTLTKVGYKFIDTIDYKFRMNN